MGFKLVGLLLTGICVLYLAGCTENSNYNANTNANMMANNNMANSNATPENSNTTSNSNRRAPTREEYERDKESYQREARESGRKIGTGLNDGWLWVKSRFELAAADDLRDSTINVDVDNGVVTLSGTVPSAAQKASAEKIVKAIEDVKSVKNTLTVSASGNTNTSADMKKY